LDSRDGDQPPGTLTRLIDQIDAGDSAAQDEFCELVYRELQEIAARVKRRHDAGSWATSDVVHEFVGQMLTRGRLGQMKNSSYFYAVAADQMGRLLIDHWRRKKRIKRGGRLERVELGPWLDEVTDSAAARAGGDLDALDQALAQLKRDRPQQHRIVMLKFFAGLTNEQVAELLGISIDKVKRDWKIAKARLGARLSDDP
jgi:RNA polymerase sigma factor (TIGR02999 family)